MRFLFLFSLFAATLFSSAHSVAKEASDTQKNTKEIITAQTEAISKIKSLYIDNVVDIKKIVFNSEVLIKIKSEEKK